VGSNPTLSAIFLVPAKRQYYRLPATALLPGCVRSNGRRRERESFRAWVLVEDVVAFLLERRGD
jgi:hypothetical protein